MTSDAMFRVRATRAEPPGHAQDDERRRTYSAALGQFDGLMAAAQAAGPAARPIALFYALSQAGRAVAAAHGKERWRLNKHGLVAAQLDREDVLEVEVRPEPRKNKAPDQIDSFAGVGAATGTELPTETMTLGQLWAAIPTTSAVDRRWPHALRVVADQPETHRRFDWDHVTASLVDVGGVTADGLRAQLQHYPTARDIEIIQPLGMPAEAVMYGGWGAKVRWPTAMRHLIGQEEALDRIAPRAVASGCRFLRPGVGGVVVSDIMLWWALLFVLSMLARYEPAGWTAALDYDRSPLAVPLTMLMEHALEHVPALILDALQPAVGRVGS